ncbi:uncharacterized protein [Brachyistius frenatus]|uniref:uncharacterized protein n=1 Tax=Brachyistius frenatus TaxID=100188 RepID=UPI0037E7B1F6
MSCGKLLLLLAVFTALVRCQPVPKVSVSPTLKQIFIGDSFYLCCNNGVSGSTVKWYVNNTPQTGTNTSLKIAVAGRKDSGSYQCEINSQKSESLTIDVLEYIPRASLTIATGHPVMPKGSAVTLKIENDQGLQGWRCWVNRGVGEKERRIVLKLEEDSVSLVFQPRSLAVPETIFWCTNSGGDSRSNQITIRTSSKTVLLEMKDRPAVSGESLTLTCLLWGTNQFSKVLFYRGGEVIQSADKTTFEIPKVTDSLKTTYKCRATFRYTDGKSGFPYEEDSDGQDMLVQEQPITAVLSDGTCSCPSCASGMSYRYFQKNDQSWQVLSSDEKPAKSGTYRCGAVWTNKKTSLSKSFIVIKGSSPTLIIAIAIALVIVGMVSVAGLLYIRHKKRNSSGPIYEDVALKERGDAPYETLPKVHGKEAEYDTLHPEAPSRERKGDEYEALKKEEMTAGVYHTLGMEGAAGGGGGYEALKKEGMKEGVYHTLGTEGAAGGGGGYEALKKEGMKEGVYHTLGTEGAAGGGYEALKKEGMKEGVYHTLGTEGAAGGGGGYEALKKEGMKEGLYHTLEIQGQQAGREETKQEKKDKDIESEIVEK